MAGYNVDGATGKNYMDQQQMDEKIKNDEAFRNPITNTRSNKATRDFLQNETATGTSSKNSKSLPQSPFGTRSRCLVCKKNVEASLTKRNKRVLRLTE